jgi:hypothetical protein
VKAKDVVRDRSLIGSQDCEQPEANDQQPHRPSTYSVMHKARFFDGASLKSGQQRDYYFFLRLRLLISVSYCSFF